MLHNTHGVKHSVFHGKNIFNLIIGGALLQKFLRVELETCVKIGLSQTILLLSISTGREVASPVVFRLVGVGEHIIVANWPLHIFLLECVDVLRWS